ncbi:MAG: DUF5714 domain-containing protein [Actinomycetota bacterium]|nr:DUF5714 domain-containing protein [Actinomycetota bacterium]
MLEAKNKKAGVASSASSKEQRTATVQGSTIDEEYSELELLHSADASPESRVFPEKGCALCAENLEYLDEDGILSCYFCGEEHRARVWCPEGHFVCRTCQHMPLSSFLEEIIHSSRSRNPFDIAEFLMSHPTLEKHSCDHAWIFTAALLIAVKNEGSISMSEDDILAALESTKEQSNPRFAHSTGVCGMVAAVGVSFQAVLSAVRGNGEQNDGTTMRVVAQAIEHLADDTSRCRCCKRVVLITLDLIVSLMRARFNVNLEGASDEYICRMFGSVGYCEPDSCQFSGVLSE